MVIGSSGAFQPRWLPPAPPQNGTPPWSSSMYQPTMGWSSSAPDLHLSTNQFESALNSLSNDILAIQREDDMDKVASCRNGMNAVAVNSTLEWLDHQIKLVEHRRIACEQQRQWISDFRLGLESDIRQDDEHRKQEVPEGLYDETVTSGDGQRKKRSSSKKEHATSNNSGALTPVPTERLNGSGKVKERHVRSLEKQLLASSRERKALQDEMEDLEEQHLALRKRHAALQAERHVGVEDLDKQHQHLKEAYEANRAECEALKRQITTLESGGEMIQRSTRLQQELDEARSENAALQTRTKRGLSAESTERTIHHQQIADLRQQLADARTMEEEYRRNYHALRTKVAESEKELKSPRDRAQAKSPREQKDDELKRKNDLLSQQVQSLKNALEAKEQDYARLQVRLAAQENEMNNLDRKLEPLTGQGSQHALPVLRARKASLERQVKTLTDERDAQDSESRLANDQMQQLQDQKKQLEDEYHSLSTKLDDLQLQLSRERQHVAELERLNEKQGAEIRDYESKIRQLTEEKHELHQLNEQQGRDLKQQLVRARKLEGEAARSNELDEQVTMLMERIKQLDPARIPPHHQSVYGHEDRSSNQPLGLSSASDYKPKEHNVIEEGESANRQVTAEPISEATSAQRRPSDLHESPLRRSQIQEPSARSSVPDALTLGLERSKTDLQGPQQHRGSKQEHTQHHAAGGHRKSHDERRSSESMHSGHADAAEHSNLDTSKVAHGHGQTHGYQTSKQSHEEGSSHLEHAPRHVGSRHRRSHEHERRASESLHAVHTDVVEHDHADPKAREPLYLGEGSPNLENPQHHTAGGHRKSHEHKRQSSESMHARRSLEHDKVDTSKVAHSHEQAHERQAMQHRSHDPVHLGDGSLEHPQHHSAARHRKSHENQRPSLESMHARRSLENDNIDTSKVAHSREQAHGHQAAKQNPHHTHKVHDPVHLGEGSPTVEHQVAAGSRKSHEHEHGSSEPMHATHSDTTELDHTITSQVARDHAHRHRQLPEDQAAKQTPHHTSKSQGASHLKDVTAVQHNLSGEAERRSRRDSDLPTHPDRDSHNVTERARRST